MKNGKKQRRKWAELTADEKLDIISYPLTIVLSVIASTITILIVSQKK